MKFRPKEPALAEVDMTPMIDIVFQLIAFFMLVNNFEQTQADERVKLPYDRLAQPPKAAPEHELMLNVGFLRDAQGNITSELLVFYNRQEVPIKQMAPTLGLEAQVYRDKGVATKEVLVTIRSDADAPFGEVQELITLAQEAGFQRFALRAKQPAGSE